CSTDGARAGDSGVLLAVRLLSGGRPPRETTSNGSSAPGSSAGAENPITYDCELVDGSNRMQYCVESWRIASCPTLSESDATAGLRGTRESIVVCNPAVTLTFTRRVGRQLKLGTRTVMLVGDLASNRASAPSMDTAVAAVSKLDPVIVACCPSFSTAG